MVEIEVKSWQFGEIEYKVSDLGEIESPGQKLPKYFWEHCYLAWILYWLFDVMQKWSENVIWEYI